LLTAIRKGGDMVDDPQAAGRLSEGHEHPPPPHDADAREPLGPVTPDDDTPLGDTLETHDELSPHDLPIDHPGRQEAERLAGGPDGLTRGNR
jgi:hypothetical protein